MKRTLYLTVSLALICFILPQSSIKGQTYLYEDFEGGDKPAGWTYIYESGIVEWQYLDGGFSNTGLPGTGHPQYAKEGFYNTMFHKESFSGEKTKLVTPEINLEFGIKPELAFWHAQDERYTFEQWNNDELRVYYKQHEDSTWKQIAEYTEKVNIWTERIIQLPDSTLSGTYYIAFEGKTNNGYGVCIDSVTIVEKGIIPRYIENIDIEHATTDFIASESDNNAILQIDFTVKGNDGQIKLDSLAVKSLNTDDSDIETNGIKLFASDDNIFANSVQIASASGFTDGIVTFDNLNRNLPTGLSSVWVTFDIVSDIDHTKHEHILDAMIESQSIKVNNSYYPIIDKSPDGERILFESILYDDFETDKGWDLTGEFERSIPLGLGGVSKGSPDPDYAVSGDYILGTDLSGLGVNIGDYELDLTDREYSASSPYINCKYYKETYIYFQRWFNMDSYDQATIDINTESADNWQTYWQSSGTSINNNWSNIKYNLDTVISRKDSIKVRYTLGPTNDFWNFSGWNIDNVVIVGNYIGRDVAITEWLGPFGGCGLTDEEYVTVKIKNLAGEPMDEPLPISFSFDGGSTIYYDTITTTIPVDDSLIYMIDKFIDLTSPGWYNNVYAKTHLAGDEETSNDTYTLDIFVSPTYTLPHSQNFESNYGYYLTGGTDVTWEYGTPAGVLINDAASGTKAWVTDLDSDYDPFENSYIESPCFNFTGNEFPIFEFKSKGYSIDSIAGLALHYSIDVGETWNIVPKNGDYYWNWYNDYDIRALGSHGIDSTKGQWLTYRQLLPVVTRNQSNVKFRFIFASDSSATKEGFGIDDIKVYEAPPNVGVTALTHPYDTCEWSDSTQLKVYIKNYGLDTLEIDQKIPIVAKFKSSETRNDTVVLTENLIPDDSTLFTFNTTFDMSYADDYRFEVYTELESNSTFYDTISNDKFIDTISVYGMPRYDVFFDIIGDNPVDTVLDAGAGYVSYLWQDLSTNQTLHALAEGTYKVTVTNDSGCIAMDTTKIFSSLIDLKMDTVFTAFADSCERNSLTEINVQIINDGFEGFDVGDSILFAYQINEEDLVLDTLWLTDTLPPNPPPSDTALFTFQQKCDFRDPDEYTLKVFTNFAKDVEHENDTITYNFNTWGYVSTELAHDTIYSSQADTLELIASPGIYTNYSWNSGQTNDTIIPSNESYYYKVTVTDANICGSDTDSTYIETYDFGVTAINGFDSDCDYNFTTDSVLNITIKNYSGNNYTSGDTIRVLYKFDEGSWVANTLTLTGNFNANTSQNFDIANINATGDGEHSLTIYTSASIDADHSNDTIQKTFETWPFPDVELAYDTIYTTRADTVVLEATTGYQSYLWTFGSTSETLTITREYSEKYVVEVQDENGCGTDKDSTQIITFNIGVSDIIFPKNACEHKTNENIIITVKNFSQDTIGAGEYLDLSYKINESSAVNESFLVETYLLPNNTRNFIFDQKADLSAIDTFYIKAYTQHELDVRRSNDTLIDAIRTYGYPTIELGADIYTSQPDTVQIIAEPGYVGYNWNNGVDNDTLNITYPATYNYILTATNINGCSTTDSIKIFTYDVGISSINTPETTCEFSSSEIVDVSVINNSQDTLLTGESIDLSYSLNGGASVDEILVLSGDLLPGSTAVYSFTSTLDLTSASNHNVKVTCSRTIDVNDVNDTLSVNIEEVGYPSFTLGGDIYTTNPVGIILTAPGGYDSYLWQDGSTNNTFTISYPASAQYIVTVTDVYGCATPDTIEVFTYNVAADTLAAPVSQCELTSSEIVTIGVVNTSKDTLQIGEPLDVGYILNSGSFISESFTLTGILYPDGMEFFNLTATADLSTNQTHNFKLFAKLTNIDVFLDDTASISVDFQKPDFNLDDPAVSEGNDYVIDPGTFTSYLWFDGSTDPTYTVDINDQNPNCYYAVTVTNSYGCEASDSLMVTFTTQPDLSVTDMITPVSGCWVESQTYPVHIEITNSGVVDLNPGKNFIVGYQIDGDTAVIEDFNLSTRMDASDTREHTFINPITFPSGKVYDFKTFATLSDDGDRSNDTLVTNVDISAPEVDFVGVSDTISFPDSYTIQINGSWLAYEWSTGETTATITVTETNTYSVTVTDEYGCQGEGSIYCINTTTGIENIIKGDGYQITYYPNPVSEKLMLEFNNQKATDVNIEIVSSNGQILYNNKLTNIENTIERIDVNPFANGVYYLRLNINNEVYIRKIIIQ